MLQPIEQLIPDPVHRLFCRFDAVDPDTGAFLWQTNGRGKGGLPTWILILPNETVAERGGLFSKDYTWEYENRKRFRAWSLAEAIEIGNRRLAKMTQPAPCGGG